MKRIGLTGGIGVGKTYVSKIFQNLGYPVFNADIQAKKCLNEDKELIQNIRNTFGSTIYKTGELQEKKLADIVFNNIQKLDQLNKLVHPVVKKRFSDWCQKQDASLVIKEAAILFESGSHLGLDAVICVSCSDIIRIERVQKRDQIKKDEVLNRINKQMLQNEKEELSNYVIVNDGSQLLLPQVLCVLKEME